MHLKDATNPIEFQLPGNNCLIVVHLVKGSGQYAPFTSFDYMLLDLVHDAVIENLVNRLVHVLLVQLTSSVVQSPRGSVNQTGVLLCL